MVITPPTGDDRGVIIWLPSVLRSVPPGGTESGLPPPPKGWRRGRTAPGSLLSTCTIEGIKVHESVPIDARPLRLAGCIRELHHGRKRGDGPGRASRGTAGSPPPPPRPPPPLPPPPPRPPPPRPA